MDKETREKLERAGWTVGSVADFLQLTPEEEAIVERMVAEHQQARQRSNESDNSGR